MNLNSFIGVQDGDQKNYFFDSEALNVTQQKIDAFQFGG